ncbi:unnamed protein product [Macrosiphum euphorbiae]|uniref:RRM domain-containing protein n=1 Tax=Macrosiphum euphorbiae TaxID=13131 RepID=A0AAV0WE82_9HEMI|nr:unnamed protein product [Macrosiphum euphorbiae]
MKNCTANILEKETVILETKGIYGENCSVKNIDRQKLSMTCKRKAVEDICQRPRKIILGEINAFGVSSKMTTNDVSAVRKCIYRARRQILPMEPTCLADIHSADEFMTTHGTHFKLISNDDSQKYGHIDGMRKKTSNCSNLYQLFIGNLTWWTTDQDIIGSIIDAGVHDFVDIKFFENQGNGQSKGFCIVTLESEKSVKQILKKLKNKLIHGRKPVVTFPSSRAYFMFESEYETQLNKSSKEDMSRIPVGNSLENPSQSVSYHTIMPLMSSCIQTHHQYPQPTGYENQWNRSYQQNMGTYFVTSEQGISGAGGSLSQINQNDHCQESVDPTLVNQTSTSLKSQSFSYDDYHPFYTHSNKPRVINEIQKTETETEINFIINRNRIVSSSAIARAVTDATNGEYVSAIETLNTAIALIEDSKIANDERSKILVCTLYNTIYGIQTRMVNKRKEFCRSPLNRLYRKPKREHS